jgi:DNA-binding transcriptional ArsR family regulator
MGKYKSNGQNILDYKPDAELLIDNLEMLKVATDPTRLDIVKVIRFENRPLSVKQIAEKLGVDPRNLYYHIKLLEEHGLIVVVETRIVSNLAEKFYHLKAIEWRIDNFILSPESGQSAYEITAHTILEDTRRDLQQALKAGLIQPHLKRSESRMMHTLRRFTPEQLSEVKKHLAEFLDYMNTLEEPAEIDGNLIYGLSVFFYPSVGYSTEEETKNV